MYVYHSSITSELTNFRRSLYFCERYLFKSIQNNIHNAGNSLSQSLVLCYFISLTMSPFVTLFNLRLLIVVRKASFFSALSCESAKVSFTIPYICFLSVVSVISFLACSCRQKVFQLFIQMFLSVLGELCLATRI